MRTTIKAALTTGIMLGLSIAAAPAWADSSDANPLDAWTDMQVAELDQNRGGAESFPLVEQVNNAHLQGSNSGDITVGPGASMSTGAIMGTNVLANHGATTVMQNTGDLVNMNYSMNVNVYLH